MRMLLLLLVFLSVLPVACGRIDPNSMDITSTDPTPAPSQPTSTPFLCRSDGAAAYAPGDEGVRGCVTDASGKPIPYASVAATSLPSGVGLLDIAPMTNENGQYWYGQLQEPGVYVITVGAAGYETTTKRVEVRSGQTAVVDIVLERQLPATATAIVASQRIVVPTPRPFACGSQTQGTTHPGSAGKYIPIIEEGYSVMGCIKDPSGGGIAGATTVAKPLKPHLSISRTEYRTGADGRYYEPNTYALGWWEVTAEAPGYEPSTERVLVKNELTVVVDFVLQPQE